MENLEFICLECKEKVILEVSREEHDHYLRTGSLIEGSEAYNEFFNGLGWVLQQSVFCDVCKYDHSEVYRED